MQTSFSTDGLPVATRIPLWREYLSRWLAEFSYRTLDEEPMDLRGSVRSTDLEQVRLAELSGSGCLVERSNRLIRSTPSDMLSLCIILRGEAVIYQPSGSAVLKKGDAVLWDMDTPTVCGLQNGFAELDITVPRDTYADRYRHDHLRVARVIRSVTGDPVSSHVAAALRVSRTPLAADPGLAAGAADAALDLFDLIVAGDARSTAGYWLSAREYIRRNLHDPLLSVPQIARAIGISERHLARVFAERSTTVARVLLEERMEAARELLADPGRRALRISEIAPMVGYASSAQFGRAFRRSFGCTPKDLRMETATRMITAARPGIPAFRPRGTEK